MKRNRTSPRQRNSAVDVCFTPLPDFRGKFKLGDGVTGELDFTLAPSPVLVPLSDARLVIVKVKLEATPEAPIDTDLWRRVPLGYLAQVANLPDNRRVITDTGHIEVEVRRPSYRVKPPAERRYSDDFYRRAAAAYQRAVTEGRPPAQTIADASDVPVTTVHRWTREARRRGFLHPARAKGQG